MAERHYHWQGRDRQGQQVQGNTTAASRAALLAQLRAQRIRVTRMRRRVVWLASWQRPSPRSSDITHFCRHLTTLLRAGVPLLQALQILQRSTTPQRMQAVLHDLHQQLEHGQSLSQAMRNHAAFDDMSCHLVHAGEQGGVLDTMLQRLTQHREKSQALRQTVRSALLYPGMVLLIALAVWVILLTWVVPVFADIYTAFDAELPALTQQALALSHAWKTHGWTVLGLAAASAIGWQQLLQHHANTRVFWHGLQLRLPLAGQVLQQACIARWCRSLSTLFAAGVPITEALLATAGVTGNLHYEKATQLIHRQLMQGKSLTQALEQCEGLFSTLLVQMCSIGEETGTLDLMLEKMAEQCEHNVETTVSRMAILLEPAVLLVLGVLLGGLVLALYGPLFQLGQAL